jgi:membrane protein implicated in regulation of membrane protease activity
MSAAAPLEAVTAAGRLLLVSADAAFYAVFGVFVGAFVVLVVVTMRWAVRRDRTGRAEWLRRQEGAQRSGPDAGTPRQTNGHVPRRKGQHGGNPSRSG